MQGKGDNPLWVHGSPDTPIEGTKYKVRSLLYDPSKDHVKNPNATGDLFTWIVPSHRGAKEYIDGFFKYYKSIGVGFIRMDFMCLFEDGIFGSGGDVVGRGYGSAEYKLALQYIKEAATKYDVFTSIVMPNMKNHGENETQYCDMTRIVATRSREAGTTAPTPIVAVSASTSGRLPTTSLRALSIGRTSQARARL